MLYIKLYYNTHRYIPNISIHIIIVYTFYIEKTRSDLSPFHSFSKMQIKERGGGYLITRYSKILESLLNREKTETLRIYIHIRFNQVWSERIENNFTRNPRSAFRSLRSSSEKGETGSRRTDGNGKRRRRLSVIVTSAFQGNEPRFTEVTVPLIERPAPPGSRPLPNNLVPIPTPLSLSSRAHPLLWRSSNLSLSLPPSLTLSHSVSYPFSQQ